MSVDFFCAVILTVFVFLGWRGGAFKQGMRVVGAILVIVASPFVARILREIAFGESSPAIPLVEATSLGAAAILIYTTVALASWLSIKVMRAASDTLSTIDRAGGAALGTLKGALLVYFLVFAALFVKPALERVDPDDRLRARDGWATSFVEEYNVLAPWHLPELHRLHVVLRMVDLAKSTSNEAFIRDNATLSEMARDERVQALLDDDVIVEALHADDYVVTLADARVRELLKDDDFAEDLDDADWEELASQLEAKGVQEEKKPPTKVDG